MEAKRELDEWRASEQSLAAFARGRGYSTQRLHWWRSRLAQWSGGAAVATPMRLVPAAVTISPEPRAAASVTLHLREDVRVEVADATTVPAQWLATVVRELLR